MSSLMSAKELVARLNRPGINPRNALRILDASWYMPSVKRDTLRDFQQAHIPTANFFDIEVNSDTTSPFPHMLPSESNFKTAVEKLGISSEDEVVVYDSHGIFSSPRVWWTFKAFGHKNVKVLDGGLPGWLSEKHDIETGQSSANAGKFISKLDPSLIKYKSDIVENISKAGFQVVDARGVSRFNGSEPDPRGLPSGHIPGSLNLPFSDLLFTGENGVTYFKPRSELMKIFAVREIDLNLPVTFTCGSGVTASILALAATECGANISVYDGSWSEYAADKTSKVATSVA